MTTEPWLDITLPPLPTRENPNERLPYMAAADRASAQGKPVTEEVVPGRGSGARLAKDLRHSARGRSGLGGHARTVQDALGDPFGSWSQREELVEPAYGAWRAGLQDNPPSLPCSERQHPPTAVSRSSLPMRLRTRQGILPGLQIKLWRQARTTVHVRALRASRHGVL
jgi:hypothetical protein